MSGFNQTVDIDTIDFNMPYHRNWFLSTNYHNSIIFVPLTAHSRTNSVSYDWKHQQMQDVSLFIHWKMLSFALEYNNNFFFYQLFI